MTINGLAIALRTKEERTFGPFAPTTIRSYYQGCVIGGAGAFVIAVEEAAISSRPYRRSSPGKSRRCIR